METMQLKASMIRCIQSIDDNDVTLLRKLWDAINKITAKPEASDKVRPRGVMTPFVQSMCKGHGIPSNVSDREIISEELERKYL